MSRLGKTLCATSLAVTATPVLAASSAVNANIRLFEDTLWLGAFLLMLLAGALTSRLSSGAVASGYLVLALAGVIGCLWKGIGLLKRIFGFDEPRWLFVLARETFEGLSGLVLAVALLVLVLALRKIYRAGA